MSFCCWNSVLWFHEKSQKQLKFDVKSTQLEILLGFPTILSQCRRSKDTQYKIKSFLSRRFLSLVSEPVKYSETLKKKKDLCSWFNLYMYVLYTKMKAFFWSAFTQNVSRCYGTQRFLFICPRVLSLHTLAVIHSLYTLFKKGKETVEQHNATLSQSRCETKLSN